MKYLVAALMIASAGPAGASEYLYTEVSNPGETMDAFVTRIAPKALEHTWKHNAEVCGPIRQTEQGYEVRISTDGRRDECSLPGDTVVYVHTHPRGIGFGFSPSDYVRPGYLITERAVKYQNYLGERSKRPRLVTTL